MKAQHTQDEVLYPRIAVLAGSYFAESVLVSIHNSEALFVLLNRPAILLYVIDQSHESNDFWTKHPDI